MAPSFLSVLVHSLLAVDLASSCGVLIHNEVLHRSSHLFALPSSSLRSSSTQHIYSDLLLSEETASYRQAGAFFPDWGYQCFQQDESAESAHWPPFLVAAVEHILATYGSLSDTSVKRSKEEQEHLEGLVAFVYAISSHQTADASWHAIRLPTGLLDALAGVDFDGDAARAHHNLDFGADFFAAARLMRMEPESRSWLSDSWTVPFNDLIAIYIRMGKAVSPYFMRYCTMRGLAALRSELVLGGSLWQGYAAESPMLLDTLSSYYLGGMDSMVAETAGCWQNLTRYLEKGIPADEKIRGGWPICDIFQAIHARGGGGTDHYHGHSVVAGGQIAEQASLLLDAMKVEELSFGAVRFTLPKFDQQPKQLHTEQLHTELKKRELEERLSAELPHFEDPVYLATYAAYGHFGSSISVGNFSADGAALAVAAPWESVDSTRPGEGSVYILPLSTLHATERVEVQSLKADSESLIDQRFGTASTSLRSLDKDLLAVSAPGPLTYNSNTPPSLPYKEEASAGRISIFAGGSAEPLFRLKFKGAEMGSIGRRWTGEQIVSGDLDDSGDEFLIVSGARGDGSRVCEGRHREQLGEGEVIVLRFKNGQSTVPSTDDFTVEQSSSGQAIDIDLWTIKLPPFEKQWLPCDKTFTYELFGSSLAVSSHSKTLFIGSPGLGKLFGYQFNTTSNDFDLVSTIDEGWNDGPRLRTDFGGGAVVIGATADDREWIAVAAKNADVGGVQQAGIVKIFELVDGEAALIGEITGVPPGANHSSKAAKFMKFGSAMTKEHKSGLYISSPWADEERGAVWFVDVESLLETIPTTIRENGHQPTTELLLDTILTGNEVNAHFGATLEWVDGKLLVGIPYSGVTREKQDERYFGSLAVFKKVEREKF